MVLLEDDRKHILDRGILGLELRRVSEREEEREREGRIEKALIRGIKCIKQRPQDVGGQRADKRVSTGPALLIQGSRGTP